MNARAARVLFTKAPSRADLASKRRLQEVLREVGGSVEREFLRVIEGLRGDVNLRDLEAAIRARDFARVERIVNAGSVAERMTGAGSVTDQLFEALRTGGDSAVRELPPRLSALSGSLNLTNPEAVRYLRETQPTMIREISDETREAVREVLGRGMVEGLSAPRMAREIRSLVGLTRERAQHVQNIRRQLETGILGGQTPPWERRLSAIEAREARRIFNDPNPDPDRIDAMVQTYAERLINRRAKDIARTETHRAFTEGKQALWEQAEADGYLIRSRTRRVWLTAGDERVRTSHASIPGMNPNGVGLDEPFKTPFGPVMGPGDNKPELIGCRCTVSLEIDE